MNIMTLRQRPEKLEALSVSHAAPPSLHPLTKLLNVLVTYSLGGLDGTESIASGTARGLGYDSPGDFRAALRANANTEVTEDLNTRWRYAMRRPFAIKGSSPNCDSGAFGATLEALFAEMPDSLQHHPFLSPNDGFPEAVYDYLL